MVVTGETSLYDEWGQRRDDFGLGELFGCAFDGHVEERMQNSYVTLEHATGHPLLHGLEGVPRVINGVRRVGAKPLMSGVRPPLTLVPSYPDLPMEMVYTSTPRTDIPAVFCSEHGKGRVVYFPMDIDRTFWEVLSPDHLALLRNAVEWAAPAVSPLVVKGQGLMDLSVWRQKDSLTVHVVNLTNPMSMKGPFREVFPIGPLEVELHVPDGTRAKSVRLLTAGGSAVWKQTGGKVFVTLPKVGVHEVVAIDY